MATERADHLITGGLVVSGRKIAKQDILVRGETIHEVGPDLSHRLATRTIDASGKYVLPGAVDAHNHPVNTDRIDSFSVSAAFGGITTVIPFIRNLRDRGTEGTTADAIRSLILS